MTSAAWELLDFVARWVHVIAGIMWVGNSLLFNWLDRSLRPPTTAERGHEALGTIWLLHSGGFYYVEKTLLRDEPLPAPLHWFKWQAYTTWLSGMALLVVVYYLGSRAVLAGAGLSHAVAFGVGLGSIAGGWALYEVMQRFVAPKAPTIAAATWIIAFVAIAIGLTQVLSGRAAYLHVGAMLGTIMAGNVFFTIVPSQRELVSSVAGGGGDAAVSARAKRVSVHNNYFTFPVIALMVSNHFPAIYGNRFAWVLLLVIVAAGAAVRLVLNLRFTSPAWKPALVATMAASSVAIYALLSVSPPSVPMSLPSTGAVTFADARHIIDRRCAVCHSMNPADVSFGPAPAGVAFDTPEQIGSLVARINERAIVTRTMPPNNKTHMTDLERAVLAKWIAEGARRE